MRRIFVATKNLGYLNAIKDSENLKNLVESGSELLFKDSTISKFVQVNTKQTPI